MPTEKPVTAGVREPIAVLLVDDSKTNLRVTGNSLTRLGCAVTMAESGEEALECIEEGPFELVLLDYQMPGLDGPETARRILARLGDKAPPILALTGGVDLDVFKACKAAGMRLVLQKPLQQAHLKALLERIEILRDDRSEN